MTRIVNPLRFALEVALIDWLSVIRPRPDVSTLGAVLSKTHPTPRAHLRWAFNANGDYPSLALGMPTGPFQVWSLPNWSSRIVPNPPSTSYTIGPVQQFGGGLIRVIEFSEPMAVVALQLAAGGDPGRAFGYFMTPTLNSICTAPKVMPGAGDVAIFAGSAMTGLMLLDASASVINVMALPCSVANAPGWIEIERVGLPIREPGPWSGVGGDHTQGQGMVSALTRPDFAAKDRLLRGGPPVGWFPELRAGVAAPIWTAPDFEALIGETNEILLRRLRVAMQQPPNLQPGVVINEPIPKPRNMAGEEMGGDPAEAQIPPLGAYLVNAMSDPFLALTLGLGTAITGEALSEAWQRAGESGQPNPDRPPPNYTHGYGAHNTQGRKVGDLFPLFMVTARYDKGLDGRSSPVEFAAVAAAGDLALPPPLPAGLDWVLSGRDRPPGPDMPWSANLRLRWERLFRQGVLRVASVGAARQVVSPASGVTTALMSERASGGFQPIAIVRPRAPSGSGAGDVEFAKAQVTDFGLDIPNNPGAVSAVYGVAQQNIFGLWSAWATTNATVAQPDPDMLRVTRMDLRASAPATSGALCPAELVMEVTLDWRVRRPAAVLLRGLFYSLPHREEATPTLTMPAGFARTIGGADGEITISFAGDVASAPGCTIVGLALKTYTNPDGTTYSQDEVVAFGAPHQPADTRRYRITIPGLQLDFNGRPHIGIGIWGLIRERMAPQRSGAWSPQPYNALASDPRPPIVTVPDTVQLASMADGRGECHAKIAWTPAASAYGYVIYQSTESKILAELGRPPPALDATLTQRLTAVKAAINAATPNQTRRAFTRRNPDLILNATSANVTLPRGTTDIHFFTVIGVSHGQIEGAWPAGAEPARSFTPIAAPKVFVPPPPRLEMREAKLAGASAVNAATAIIESRPGHDVQRFELFMVRNREAAKELDTMGEALEAVQIPGAVGWTIEDEAVAGMTLPLRRAQKTLSPQGSWKPAWFRAVAWGKPDPDRGAFGGRSAPSAAMSVLVPPAAGPVLSAVTMSQPGPDPAEILLEWTSPAPLKDTPLGPHRMLVTASGGLFAFDNSLSEVPSTEGAAANRFWRSGDSGAVTYRLRLRRAAASDSVTVLIRLSDPLGRVVERSVTAPSGSVEPAPTITGLTATALSTLLASANFSSNAPIAPRPAGVTRLRVYTMFKRRTGWFGWLFPPPRPRTDEIDAPSIPAAAAAPNPTAAAPFTIVRTGPGLAGASYEAKLHGRVASITVTVLAPDGRTAQQTAGL